MSKFSVGDKVVRTADKVTYHGRQDRLTDHFPQGDMFEISGIDDEAGLLEARGRDGYSYWVDEECFKLVATKEFEKGDVVVMTGDNVTCRRSQGWLIEYFTPGKEYTVFGLGYNDILKIKGDDGYFWSVDSDCFRHSDGATRDDNTSCDVNQLENGDEVEVTFRGVIHKDHHGGGLYMRVNDDIECVLYEGTLGFAERCVIISKKPEPEEPTGLGAVVEADDDSGERLTLVRADQSDVPWAHEGGWFTWDQFSNITVLSAGVEVKK